MFCSPQMPDWTGIATPLIPLPTALIICALASLIESTGRLCVCHVQQILLEFLQLWILGSAILATAARAATSPLAILCTPMLEIWTSALLLLVGVDVIDALGLPTTLADFESRPFRLTRGLIAALRSADSQPNQVDCPRKVSNMGLPPQFVFYTQSELQRLREQQRIWQHRYRQVLQQVRLGAVQSQLDVSSPETAINVHAGLQTPDSTEHDRINRLVDFFESHRTDDESDLEIEH